MFPRCIPLPRPSAPALLAAFLLLAAVPALAARSARPDEDLGAVRAVLARQLAAWNRGDLDGFMGGYWKSDSLTFYGGSGIAHGWQVTYDRYHKRYLEGGAEMGTLAFDLHDVTLMGRGWALVRGSWALTLKSGAPHGEFTLVLRHVPGAGWRIVHDHSSSASP